MTRQAEETHQIQNMTVSVWVINEAVLGFEIVQKYNSGTDSEDIDRLEGSAKWDGCWNMEWKEPGMCMHLCDVQDLIGALTWIEQKRREKIENAE